jgi:hypothetical protein
MHWASPEERRNLGQARRKQVGRQEHIELRPKARQTPALSLLEHASKGRVPALIKLKYHLMAESPFGYFRGAVPVMAADLSVLPNTGIVCQICGDAHVRNLGAFAAPDGRLVFDINDFDETTRAPFEWDLKRMAASLVLAGRESGHKDAASRAAVESCIERYATQMAAFADGRTGARCAAEGGTGDADSHAGATHGGSQQEGRRAAAIQRREADVGACEGEAGGSGAGGVGALSIDTGAAATAFALALPAGGCGLQSGGNGVGGTAGLLHLSRRKWGERPFVSPG